MSVIRSPRNTKPTVVPVILAGGKGTRLWPASREARPKPFLKLSGDHSLLQNTLLRAAPLASGCVLIATHEDYRFQAEEEVAAIRERLHGVEVRYQLEPAARNTAPAVFVAACHVREHFGDDAIMVVMPSDHVIRDEDAFHDAVASAVTTAGSGLLVALGVRPAAAETAFGYLLPGSGLDGLPAHAVQQFIEKPCRRDAEQYLADDRYLWNSGIFCFSTAACEQAFARHAPRLHLLGTRSWLEGACSGGTSPCFRPEAGSFQCMEDISFDYALMERMEKLAVVPVEMGWTDLGSWRTVTDLVEPDLSGNRVLGNAVLVDTRNTYVQSDGRLVAAVGVEDLVIVDTPDAVLVGSSRDAQKVRLVVERLRAARHEARVLHRTVHRPWGTYTVVEEGPHYKIKRLCVKPGAALSLQVHRYRSEHWVLVEGEAWITNGELEFLLEKDQSAYIPAGNRHRLENIGTEPVVIIETQTGSYLGEDDIVRLEDDYGRADVAPKPDAGGKPSSAASMGRT